MFTPCSAMWLVSLLPLPPTPIQAAERPCNADSSARKDGLLPDQTPKPAPTATVRPRNCRRDVFELMCTISLFVTNVFLL